MPESLTEYTKHVSCDFLIVLHFFELSFPVVRTFQNLDLKVRRYLFIYLFIYLLEYWKYSLRSIMKNQNKPFTNVEKIAAEFFFKNSQENTRVGISF